MAARKKDPQRTAAQHTDAELDVLAAITPEDIARAKAAWRQDASPAFRDLLDATPDEEPGPNGCLEATARGRVAIGTLPPVGRRTSRCRCRIRYLDSEMGQVAA